eukprot:778053-Alexandrium_andersonii.AAC.1
MARLIKFAPESLIAIIQNAEAWQTQAKDDLSLLHSVSGKLAHLPPPHMDTGPWEALIRDFPKQWASIVKKAVPLLDKALRPQFFSTIRTHPGRGPPEPEQITEATPRCEQCGKMFKSMRAKTMHAVRVHGHSSAVALRISTPWCPACL